MSNNWDVCSKLPQNIIKHRFVTGKLFGFNFQPCKALEQKTAMKMNTRKAL